MTIATIQQSRDRSPSRRQDSTPPWLTSLTSLTSRKGLSPAKTTFRLAISYVTHLIEFGYPERFVQEQVGHAYASTTAIYASVSDDFKHQTLRAALARVYGHTNQEERS
jgi:site-specific recombinase XerD